jgi:hypothetical protein
MGVSITSGGGAIVTNSHSVKGNEQVFLATQAREEMPHYQHSEIDITIEQ